MSFLEVEFMLFLPLAVALHWALPRRRLVQNAYLIVVSCIFYAFWNWRLLSVLLVGTGVDFLVLRYLTRLDPSGTELSWKRRAALLASLASGLGALAFFKYEGFFAHSFNALTQSLGLGGSLPVLNVLLPLGISFYTLQRIGYVVDVYWGQSPGPRSFVDFLLFVCFFPQLTAGPISRGGELMPQLEKPRLPSAAALADGASMILLGYVLKGWAADTIGQKWVDPVFAAHEQFGRLSHLLGMVGYAMQVFGDFAGYNLMAIGAARLFSIDLPVNFNFPFLSQSVAELWRRWHITLNRWLFEYIFTPLTTSRGWFRERYDLALLITFLASGLWHGASWTFVSWGLVQGLGMIVHRNWDERYRGLCRRDRKYVRIRQSRPYGFAAWLLTISFFVLSLIPFRASSFEQALSFARSMILGNGTRSLPYLPSVVLSALFVVGYHLLDLPGLRHWRARFFLLPAPVRGIIYGLVIGFLMAEVPVSAGTFIYQQF